MANECSKTVKNFIIGDSKTRIQFVEGNEHQVHAAKQANQTVKNHLIARLCTVHKLFPIQLWWELLQQCEITLNLLRASKLNPKLSFCTPCKRCLVQKPCNTTLSLLQILAQRNKRYKDHKNCKILPVTLYDVYHRQRWHSHVNGKRACGHIKKPQNGKNCQFNPFALQSTQRISFNS